MHALGAGRGDLSGPLFLRSAAKKSQAGAPCLAKTRQPETARAGTRGKLKELCAGSEGDRAPRCFSDGDRLAHGCPELRAINAVHATPPNASFFCLAAKNRGGWATALLFVAAPPFDAGANVTVWRVCANYFTRIFDKTVASVSARNTTQASLHIQEILTADDVNIEMACCAKGPHRRAMRAETAAALSR